MGRQGAYAAVQLYGVSVWVGDRAGARISAAWMHGPGAGRKPAWIPRARTRVLTAIGRPLCPMGALLPPFRRTPPEGAVGQADRREQERGSASRRERS